MANALGYVSETKTGFEGALAMMNLSAAIRIEKNAEKAADGQPDYRIFAGETSTEIGGGWLRKAKQVGCMERTRNAPHQGAAFDPRVSAFHQRHGELGQSSASLTNRCFTGMLRM